MAEYNFPIPGSLEEEKIVLFIRRHWASFLGQFLLSTAMLILPAIILIIALVTQPQVFKGMLLNFLVMGLSIYYLIALTVAFVAWISFYYDVYIIYADSVVDIVQQGFFGRKISQLSILRVQDVSSDIKGFLPTFFGFGDVLVETAGEQSQNFLLVAVPQPQKVASKIMELHDQLVAKEDREPGIIEGEGVLESQTEDKDIKEEQPETAPPTTYQDLMEKEQKNQQNQPSPQQQTSTVEKEGEISHDELDKGGEIKLNDK
ncbi:MAG: PH domain-containing protein [Patescibacteria group bacterium]